MANDGKITSLTTIAAIDPANDVLEIVDVSANASNKVTPQGLFSLTSNAVGLSDTQTLTNKTLTAPTIASPIFSGTITGTYTFAGSPTFPAAVVTLTGSQTLTNKVLTSPTISTPTITNASITQDAVIGFTAANNGTLYGIAVTASKISGASLTASTIPGTALSTDSSWAWTTYTPSFTGGSPNLGSTGTISGRYAQIGKTVHFRIQITVGGSGISAGSGVYSISLPVTAQSTFVVANGNPFIGNTNLYQSSGSLNFLGITQLNSTTTVQIVVWTLTTVTTGAIFALGVWGSSVVSLATGNIATIVGTYEAT